MTSKYGFQESQTEGKQLDEEEFGTDVKHYFIKHSILSENKINIWLLLKGKHRQKTLCRHFSENAAAEI